ncbi:MAG: cryptochrome/photolyase family protein [Gammaproteobacteria bacterium]|nr:cryptochrome/photolyase family protein [Gammaproteobacteria bacterium]
MKTRRLILILGDQLDSGSVALRSSNKDEDRIVMIETGDEAGHVWNHKHRIAIFIAAMRHFAADLGKRGWQVHYRSLVDDCPSIAAGLKDAITQFDPESVHMLEAGEWRLEKAIADTCNDSNCELITHEDQHFLCTRKQFAQWAEGRKSLRMEYFYRELRRQHDVLMDGDKPLNGQWNFDKSNRESFGRDGPGELPPRLQFEPDNVTREVLAEVGERFADHPGSLENFFWPVTAQQAQRALDDFIDNRLACYGRYQDAMWQGEPYLYHALLGSSINLHLLDPRDVIAAAEQALHDGKAPIEAVEGFIRQILGWREFIRGIYWLKMPGYAERNHYGHERELPDWFWTGDTEMNCLQQTIGDTLAHGYAHHIQRLMIVGNFALLAGLRPAAVSDWFLAVYVDAVEWVELPNVLGMALHADGGLLGSKPYVSTGSYINRMSNYCKGCRFDPKARTGEDACPFTTLYWDFLARNRKELEKNPRMARVISNLDRWSPQERGAITRAAQQFRKDNL